MAAILKKYVFNKTARTITFSDFPSILLQDIGEIVNVTRNIVIYEPLNGATGATSLVDNVLTLAFDTSAYENTDVLRIVYGDSFAQKITVGSGGGGGGGGGGDASASLQTAGNNTLTAINNKTPALGQALAGASIPVVLPSAQITTLTPPPAITNFALDSTVAKDGTDITTPTAMPTGGAGIRGWLSAIWTKLNGNISVNGNIDSVGAIASASLAYRTAITAPDIATPTVGTITTAAGGSLTAVAHHVRVVGVNAFGCSLPVIPAGNGITATASGVIRIPITVGDFTAFDIFMSTATDPLYLGRITAAQVTAGSLITAAATASANCSQSAGGTAGVVECRVLGTQRAASTETIPFSFVMPATPVNCTGKQFVDFDVEVTLTASPVLPVIVVVPFFLNSLTNNYVQSDIVSTLNLSTGTSNRTRLRYQVQGNTGVHLAVQSIVGVGASINMWSSVS